MKSLWNDQEARAFTGDDLALRVYTSRLLGRESALVLHGGGNTSVKSVVKDLYGQDESICFIKGSGWDLATIEKPGFAPVRLEPLKRLATLPALGDGDMVKAMRSHMTDPGAPTPSVEAILHAVLPFKFVDHTHADAVVTLTNTPDGEKRIKALYGERVLYIPYVMPGFILAKAIAEALIKADVKKYEGMVLLNHGIFTWHDDARTSYETMIRLVSEAEVALEKAAALPAPGAPVAISGGDLAELAETRRQVSTLRGRPVVTHWLRDGRSADFSKNPKAHAIAAGPLTPDHVIRTKPRPASLDTTGSQGIGNFAADYEAYFKRNAQPHLKRLDTAPRWAIWKDRGLLAFGQNLGEAQIIRDLLEHTVPALLQGTAMGGYVALPEKDIFEMEYWELEQAKLKGGGSQPPLMGKIALVSGSAGGIGKACALRLAALGAVVATVDIKPMTATDYGSKQVAPVQADLGKSDEIKKAVENCVALYGGLDILVLNAGIFPPSETIAEMAEKTWDDTLRLNLTSHQRMLQAATPFLKKGIDPRVVFIGSKNVPAPGPGVSAYSVAKAGLAQLARVAAMELAGDGIRVNTVHPNMVFDTGIWSDEVLTKRAAHYGLSVEAYKKNNLLKTEITSAHVADLVATLCLPVFDKTTGAQIPIDGGNDRVI